VVRNLVSSSPLHFRGIGLKCDTHSMFVKRKLHTNSNRLDMGIFTINMPMKNCLLLCIRVWICYVFHFLLHI
jgi:hypothetical protein